MQDKTLMGELLRIELEDGEDEELVNWVAEKLTTV